MTAGPVPAVSTVSIMPPEIGASQISRVAPEDTIATNKTRPFLKWAGGKRQLLPQIRRFYPESFRNYVEPFVGSGAVFFDLHNRGLLSSRHTTLIDSNADLVGCYLNVRDHTAEVVKSLSRLAAAHKRDPEQHYYRVRNKRFNPGRARITSGYGPNIQRYTPQLAAMLIYLNRTGFNGLFRLNSQGAFNVPIGRYKNPTVCDADNLASVANALSSNVTIVHGSFETVLKTAKKGDLVYFDPPYAPLTETAQFTSYTAAGFSTSDQERLQQVMVHLARKGCSVLLSNSTAPEISRLYDGNVDAEAAGLCAYKIPARRMINSAPEKRGAVLEYLITNVPRRPEET